jgi:hypothetical protein
MDERRRLEGVTVVSIDANRIIAAELFVRLARVPQPEKSPANASGESSA